MGVRPEAGGFPYLTEVLRQAGVKRNLWFLPSLQSIYITDDGPVLEQGSPLVTGTFDVPAFNREAVISALRTDQAGKSTFPEFLNAIWQAGVVRYEVDFSGRTVTYYGCTGEVGSRKGRTGGLYYTVFRCCIQSGSSESPWLMHFPRFGVQSVSTGGKPSCCRPILPWIHGGYAWR